MYRRIANSGIELGQFVPFFLKKLPDETHGWLAFHGPIEKGRGDVPFATGKVNPLS